MTGPPSQKKHKIQWNPELQEWFCASCGRVSGHRMREGAQAEMELFDCQPPAADWRTHYEET